MSLSLEQRKRIQDSIAAKFGAVGAESVDSRGMVELPPALGPVNGPEYLGDDATRPELGPEQESEPPLLAADEMPGMDPSELAQYPGARKPLAGVASAAPEDDGSDLRAAYAKQDRSRSDNAFAARMSNAGEKLSAALSRGAYKPTYQAVPSDAEADPAARAMAVQNYLKAKRGDPLGDDYKRALMQSMVDRHSARSEPKESAALSRPPIVNVKDPAADPLLEEKRAEIQARTAKLNRVPVAKAAKEGKNLSTGIPEGYEPSPTNPPSEENKKKFTGLVFSQQKMRGLTNDMRQAVAEAGKTGGVLPGPLRSRLKALATQIRIEAKNVAELGALSGPDMGLIEAISADPTELKSLAADVPGQLSGLDKWADNSVGAGLKAYGVRKIGAPAEAAGQVQMLTAAGKKVMVPADKVSEAETKFKMKRVASNG